ncbi:MAG: Phosphoribosylaminoimidazole-succinocarboxamide synthase [Sodalis sp.]|nr:MAG: Phosphoribosylaminoimidazole-succinocarboxamide synthase [Sodalis sp.]
MATINCTLQFINPYLYYSVICHCLSLEYAKMQKLAELYFGKAKTIYTTEDPDFLILTLRNDTSALEGQLIKQFEHKGMINNNNYFIMTKLAEAGISA